MLRRQERNGIKKERNEAMSFKIAIDGPAGAGKSTIARRAAAELGFLYVDTGAMYRAIALGLLRMGTNVSSEAALADALSRIEVGLGYEDGIQKVFLNGEDVSSLIRTEEVSNMASSAAAKPQVRAKLTQLQRGIAEENNVLMDGRDIGTVILPDAQLKIYLTASVETRAQRRYKELCGKGETAIFDEIAADIRERDYRDMHRETAPLRQAEDAVLVDSSELTVEEVTARIISLVRAKRQKNA